MPSQPHSVTAQNSKFGLLTRPLGPLLQNNEYLDSRSGTSHSSEFSQRRETLSATYYKWRLLSNLKSCIMHYTTSHALKCVDDSNVAVTFESSTNFWKDMTFFFFFHICLFCETLCLHRPWHYGVN